VICLEEDCLLKAEPAVAAVAEVEDADSDRVGAHSCLEKDSAARDHCSQEDRSLERTCL